MLPLNGQLVLQFSFVGGEFQAFLVKPYKIFTKNRYLLKFTPSKGNFLGIFICMGRLQNFLVKPYIFTKKYKILPQQGETKKLLKSSPPRGHFFWQISLIWGRYKASLAASFLFVGVIFQTLLVNLKGELLGYFHCRRQISGHFSETVQHFH